eukprot:1179498-Prorocentrum_minimum.AAC.5
MLATRSRKAMCSQHCDPLLAPSSPPPHPSLVHQGARATKLDRLHPELVDRAEDMLLRALLPGRELDGLAAVPRDLRIGRAAARAADLRAGGRGPRVGVGGAGGARPARGAGLAQRAARRAGAAGGPRQAALLAALRAGPVGEVRAARAGERGRREPIGGCSVACGAGRARDGRHAVHRADLLFAPRAGGHRPPALPRPQHLRAADVRAVRAVGDHGGAEGDLARGLGAQSQRGDPPPRRRQEAGGGAATTRDRRRRAARHRPQEDDGGGAGVFGEERGGGGAGGAVDHGASHHAGHPGDHAQGHGQTRRPGPRAQGAGAAADGAGGGGPGGRCGQHGGGRLARGHQSGALRRHPGQYRPEVPDQGQAARRPSKPRGAFPVLASREPNCLFL